MRLWRLRGRARTWCASYVFRAPSRSPFYNVLSRFDAEIMSQLHDYGHHIAAHVDPAAYDGDCARALTEIEIFSKFYPYTNTEIASFHSSYDLHHMPNPFHFQI